MQEDGAGELLDLTGTVGDRKVLILLAEDSLGQLLRSIPAGAGPTTATSDAPRHTEEHPRGCGADDGYIGKAIEAAGASPRVRGRLESVHQPLGLARSIPAGAGPTEQRRPRCGSGAEHPRGCGADLHPDRRAGDARGASPRVRGRPSGRPRRARPGGSIPAGAGPTPAGPTPQRERAEHPRGCGADRTVSSAARRARGASPRVRGRQAQHPGRGAEAGSIPAGAGPTGSAVPARPPTPEHPRGCGADRPQELARAERAGASPRVRGRRLGAPRQLLVLRSIPAGAGPTIGQSLTLLFGEEHPRGCGADARDEAPAPTATGASPRVRGRHLLTWEVTARVPHFHSCASPFVRGSGANGDRQRS